jgi:hypothetical protein
MKKSEAGWAWGYLLITIVRLGLCSPRSYVEAFLELEKKLPLVERA